VCPALTNTIKKYVRLVIFSFRKIHVLPRRFWKGQDEALVDDQRKILERIRILVTVLVDVPEQYLVFVKPYLVPRQIFYKRLPLHIEYIISGPTSSPSLELRTLRIITACSSEARVQMAHVQRDVTFTTGNAGSRSDRSLSKSAFTWALKYVIWVNYKNYLARTVIIIIFSF